MRNCKGFSLIEVLTALSVFTITATATLPLLVHVYEERLAIQEEQEALSILHNRIQSWVINGDEEPHNAKIIDASQSYKFTEAWINAKDTMKMCLIWTGSNERGYKKCGYAKKPIVEDSP